MLRSSDIRIDSVITGRDHSIHGPRKGDHFRSLAGGTPLERILPVDMDPSSRKVLPSIALVLVIDASGSMSGEPIEMARQAAMAAVQELSDRDYVGVLAFDGAPYLVADLQSAANRRDLRLERLLDNGAPQNEGRFLQEYPRDLTRAQRPPLPWDVMAPSEFDHTCFPG